MRNLILILMLLFAIKSNAQNSTIKGVVTYYFNEYQGDKPDIGSEVFIIDSLNDLNFNYLVVDSYINASATFRYLEDALKRKAICETYAEHWKGKKKYKDQYDREIKNANSQIPFIDELKKQLSTLNISSKDNLDSLDNKSAISLYNGLKSDVKTVVDGIGNFSISVKPGIYYVIIISKGRHRPTKTEVMGQVDIQKVIIKENETKSIGVNFKL